MLRDGQPIQQAVRQLPIRKVSQATGHNGVGQSQPTSAIILDDEGYRLRRFILRADIAALGNMERHPSSPKDWKVDSSASYHTCVDRDSSEYATYQPHQASFQQDTLDMHIASRIPDSKYSSSCLLTRLDQQDQCRLPLPLHLSSKTIKLAAQYIFT